MKEADLKETLQLLSLRLGLEPPYPELLQPPWVPPNHPLAEARMPPGPETLGLCVAPSRRPPGVATRLDCRGSRCAGLGARGSRA